MFKLLLYTRIYNVIALFRTYQIVGVTSLPSLCREVRETIEFCRNVGYSSSKYRRVYKTVAILKKKKTGNCLFEFDK